MSGERTTVLRGNGVRLRSSNAAPHMSIDLSDCYAITPDEGQTITGPVEITIRELNDPAAPTQTNQPIDRGDR